eukprot:1059521-Prymnesium_polylepis.1
MPWAPPMCMHVRVQCCVVLGVLTWGNRGCCDGSNGGPRPTPPRMRSESCSRHALLSWDIGGGIERVSLYRDA